MKKIAVILAVLSVLCPFARPAGAQPSPSPAAGAGYRIGPRDLVKIEVYDVPELNVERRVSESGAINLPLIGDVPVGGKTEEQVTQDLKDLLGSKYLQRASVGVKVLEFRARPIAVLGAVKQPGNLAFSGRWSLLEALTAAGGLAENHGNVIYILRRADNGLSDQIAVNVDELMVRADPLVNVPIFANDLINVPATVEVTVYCLGQVGQPGALTFKSTERITLLAAIARAGGLTDRASSRILIKRATPPAGTGGRAAPELTVDYKRILASKDPDVVLQEGDVVVVKESFF
ncbi:MAG TPA: polysaccharide biosynthesis/export family protein [Thermoanaerobaculia bacterium]|jgi:polysaccharide export outer membrane protein|nr:polysaccharide biosynthesis/export family protein [Thermoanaerobaculia bacterium]